MESRRRAGVSLTDMELARLEAFNDKLAKADLVIAYDPDTEEGFVFVPRRTGIDLDMIREPGVD